MLVEDDESSPFVTIDHLENIVGKRLKDNIVKKKDMYLKAQAEQGQQPTYEPTDPDDAEGGVGND